MGRVSDSDWFIEGGGGGGWRRRAAVTTMLRVTWVKLKAMWASIVEAVSS